VGVVKLSVASATHSIIVSDKNSEQPIERTNMKTLAKTLASIVAMSGLVTAQENTSPSDTACTSVTVGEAADAKLNGYHAGEEREFEIAPGVKMRRTLGTLNFFGTGSIADEQRNGGWVLGLWHRSFQFTQLPELDPRISQADGNLVPIA
jgi:hypothetical protein